VNINLINVQNGVLLVIIMTVFITMTVCSTLK